MSSRPATTTCSSRGSTPSSSEEHHPLPLLYYRRRYLRIERARAIDLEGKPERWPATSGADHGSAATTRLEATAARDRTRRFPSAQPDVLGSRSASLADRTRPTPPGRQRPESAGRGAVRKVDGSWILLRTRWCQGVGSRRGHPRRSPGDASRWRSRGRLDGVALVTLDRPAVLNALSFGLLDELAGALEALDADRAVRCVDHGRGRAGLRRRRRHPRAARADVRRRW